MYVALYPGMMTELPSLSNKTVIFYYIFDKNCHISLEIFLIERAYLAYW